MFDFSPNLPIDPILRDICATLGEDGLLVLQAPPGAGKTTRVPLAIHEAKVFSGKVVMLEPRRLAARAAAERLSSYFDEAVGQTVGLRMRGVTKISARTKIEIVTEAVLTRMIQSDPELSDYSCILFDEFHERSLNADLGLALALDIRRNLREDLAIVVMSATLDAAPIAEFFGARILTAEGRSFPVDINYSDKPVGILKYKSFQTEMASLIEKAVSETTGDILAFCPGEGEIRGIADQLANKNLDLIITPLYGALPFKDQQAAIRPAQKRKLVLATSIAETSLTIDGITVVIDGGLARRAKFDPASGMQKLVTERASKAEATQRMGRAGRVAAGTCYRLWSRGEEGAMQAFAPAEIETADLTALALELAAWGVTDPTQMAFLTQPKTGQMQEAKNTLKLLGALDDHGRLTDFGKTIAAYPTHPRLAAMLTRGASPVDTLAAVLEERDPLDKNAGADIELRLRALKQNPKNPKFNRITSRASLFKPKGDITTPALLCALAYPDRIGRKRKSGDLRYHLSNGKETILTKGDALAGHEFIVALNLDGDAKQAKLRLGIGITRAEIETLYADKIEWRKSCQWDKRTTRVVAKESMMLGELALEERRWNDADPTEISAAMLTGLRQLGLNALDWNRSAQLLRARIAKAGPNFPDMSDVALLDNLEDWLLPFLNGIETKAQLNAVPVAQALGAWLGWDQTQELDKLVPATIVAPTGTKLKIDYSGDTPKVSVRIQEVFGLTIHPTIGTEKTPLLFELLSPAQRPIQLTNDLLGFWAGSYSDLRKDMRAQYPKHYWPEDPSVAEPTRYTKGRMSGG